MLAEKPPLKPPSRKQLVREYATGKLMDTLFGKYSRGWSRNELIVNAITEAHNDGDIDLLSILTPDTLDQYKGGIFFQGQTLYCSLIPKISASARDMIAAVDNLIQAAGNDGAAGLPANALAEWCEAEPSRPAEILELIDEGSEAATKFITPALRIGTAFDRSYFIGRAIAFSKNGSADEQRGSIRALGQVDPLNAAEWDSLINTLDEIRTSADDTATAAIIAAATLRLKSDNCPRVREFESIIQDSLSTAGVLTLHQCADLLWLDHKAISDSLKTQILEALLNVDCTNIVTIDYLDHGLAEMVKNSEANVASIFLGKLLKKNEGNLEFKQFKSTRRAIQSSGDHIFEDWLVDWFLGGDFELCRQMSDALFGVGDRETAMNIDFARYNLKERDYGYLARKAIGFIFLHSVVPTSIIISLLRSAPKSIAMELEELLFNPMLINYSGVGKDYLEPLSRDKQDEARHAANRALQNLDNYLDGLGALRNVKELRPSERQRQAEWQRHSDAMAEAHRLADKKSIFADLFKKVVVLYGNRSISYVKHGKEAPKRFETKMASHGVSFELPRVDIVDSIGLQQMLLSFRSEQRPA